MNKELLANNTRIEVPIFKQFHKFLIGKDGANIKKVCFVSNALLGKVLTTRPQIRDETNTKIELPAEGSDSEVILISGKRKDVELAKEKVQKFQTELINVVQMDIIIPARIHNSIIGARGRLIRSIMDECGGVQIKFPSEGSGSDKVSIRGPKDCVVKAKNMLVELSNEKQVAGFTAEVKAKPEHHRFLIGKNGANVRRVRESTGAQILFPSEKEKDGNDTIVIIGRKEEVAAAKKELEELVRGLDRIVEDFVHIEHRHHGHFVARRGNFLRLLADEFGGVSVSFPRSSDKENSRVVLKGAKECVEGAKKKLLDEVARLQSLVQVEVAVDQVHHRSLMGSRGNNVKAVQAAHNVHIKFPERKPHEPKTNGDHVPGLESANGDAHSDDTSSVVSDTSTPKRRRNDVILISGRPEDCEAAKQALLSLIPVEVEVQVPYDYHRFIIGQKGKDVRELMEQFDVSVSVPPSTEKKDTIRITGAAENAAGARDAILSRVQQLEGDKQDREARSFRVQLHVDPVCHPKIIGKKGAVVTKIRNKFDVQIQFPERNSAQNGPDSKPQDQTLITVIGYEQNALAAKQEIMSLVKDMESQVSKEVRVDARVHPRLIGGRGKSIRKIMDQFRVDVKFPRSGDPDPNVVTISGNEEDVDAAKEHILHLEEEYVSSRLTD